MADYPTYTFSVPFADLPWTEALFQTGDTKQWLVVSRKQLERYTSGQARASASWSLRRPLLTP